tara:strand:- start:123 stop:554 length:432 start_codon:yes stop_codon:yes gene_type:complete
MAITQPTKPNVDQGTTDIPSELDIYFNGVEYKPKRQAIQEITFLGTKTMQAKVKENLTIFWNPLTWDWTKLADKEAYENKYKRKTRSVYFKEKVFLVESAKFKKGIVDDDFVDTAELPIGIVVYWETDTKEWQMLGYKENLLR